ncbi:MAG: hypothetical protein ACF8XB_24505, partial [Planctomycetota bacterium JB042]
CGAELEYTGLHDAEAPRIAGVASRGRCIRVHASRGSARSRDAIVETLSRHNVVPEPIRPEDDRIDVLIGTEEVPDAEGVLADIRRRLDGVAEVSGSLASVSVVASNDGDRDELADRVDDVLRRAGADTFSRHDRPLSITRSVAAEHRLPAILALHEALVESHAAVAAAR